MAISLLDKKAKRLRSIMERVIKLRSTREKAKINIPINEKAKTHESLSEKASNPRPHKPSNTQQKSLIKQGGNSNIKNAKKNERTPVSTSPFFDEKRFNVMTKWEQQDYLDELARIPKYETSKMTKLEAMDAIEKIKSNTCSTMRMCYELATRKGYEALGYKDFKECVMKELAGVIGYDYAHKMKNAGEVHVVVCPELPMGTVHESVLRPMHGLSDENMKKVWNTAHTHDFVGSYPPEVSSATARDINCTIRAIGLAEDTIDVKDLERLLHNIEFSPKLMEKVQKNILELIKEYIEKSSINPTLPVSIENFEKVVRILLNALRTTILSDYEKLYGQKK